MIQLTQINSCSISCAAVAFFASAARISAADSLPQITLRDAYPALKFERPLWMEEAPDGSKRMVLIEQDGRIWWLPQDRNGAERKMFLDVTGRKTHVQNEEGLLAFAFHPQFKANGRFYIYYSEHSPKRNVLSEMQVSRSDPNKADPATERMLMEIPQPYWNHDGSAVVFGPDGFLYFSTGDGGLGGDPHNVGQSGHHLLGKILRIDVNSQTGRL